jgi:predicted Zn finger-like uncharacterized protein
MPISVKCPECEAPYKVPDEAAGKAIKCKKCGAKISVPAADADEGGGNDFAGIGDSGDSGSATKEKKKGSKNVMLIVGGIVLLLGCCCVVPSGVGGLGWWLGWFGGTHNVVVKDVVVKEKAVQFKDDPFKAFKDDPFKDINKKKTSLDRKDPLAPKEPRVAVLSRDELWASRTVFAVAPAERRCWRPASVASGAHQA